MPATLKEATRTRMSRVGVKGVEFKQHLATGWRRQGRGEIRGGDLVVSSEKPTSPFPDLKERTQAEGELRE